MTPDELEQIECYYFGVWGQPGHYTYNRNRQGINPSTTPGEVPTFLAPSSLDQRFCRNPGGQYVGDEPEGLVYLHIVEPKDVPFDAQKWTVIAFNDRSGESRPGSNSAFIANGVYSFRDMINIARVQYPTLWKRMTDKFELQDIRTVR